MVKCIQRSPVRKKKFFDFAEKNFKMETRKKFRLDMPVRWNSTYFLLDHALYYKDVFIYLSERDSAVKSLVPSGDDWVKVAYVHKFLKVFYDVTNLFSASRHPTSNSYVHGVWKIQSALKDIENGPGYFLTDTVARMQAKFNKYWSDYNTVLCCATLLDPRYKVTFLKYCFVKNYGQEGATSRVDKVTDTLKLWFKEYNKLSDFQGDVLNTGCNLSTSNESELDDYEMFVNEEMAQTVGSKSELDLYLEEPIIARNDNLDILDYWFKTSVRYPTLSALARDILTIPVSTVSSESAFSIGGKIITPTRASLKPKTVQALVCLRDWMLAICDGDEAQSSSDEDDEIDAEEFENDITLV